MSLLLVLLVLKFTSFLKKTTLTFEKPFLKKIESNEIITETVILICVFNLLKYTSFWMRMCNENPFSDIYNIESKYVHGYNFICKKFLINKVNLWLTIGRKHKTLRCTKRKKRLKRWDVCSKCERRNGMKFPFNFRNWDGL